MIALLSIVAFIGRDIHAQQANVAERLRAVELNQAKMMGVLGVEPCSSLNQVGQYASDIPP